MNSKSLKRHEGYLMIDNRAGGGALMETSTYTCSHCQRVVVKNPLRVRERAYCPKCDHYLCDECGARRAADGGNCLTFNQIADEVQEAGERGLPVKNPLLIL